MMAGIRIELVEGAALTAQARAAWDDLAGAAATPNIFHERWMVECCLTLPEAAGLRLVLAWEGDTLIGLLPVQDRRAGGVRIALQTWEQRVRALGEPLLRDGYETAFWTATLAALSRSWRAGLYLRLTALDADSPSTHALLALTPALETRRVGRAILRGGAGAAEHRATHIRGKVLKEHRRLRNRLADRGTVSSDTLAPDADPAPWIDALFALELAGWKGRDGVAAATDPIAEACFRGLLTEAHASGRLDFRRLALNGVPLAMLATITTARGHAFQLKIAYDEDHAAFSPGVLLEMDFLDHALDRAGYTLTDSCARAGHPMIDRIWVDRRTIVSLAVPYDRTISRLAVAALGRVRRRRGGAG